MLDRFWTIFAAQGPNFKLFFGAEPSNPQLDRNKGPRPNGVIWHEDEGA